MIYKINATGNGAMAESMTVPASAHYELVSISLKMSAGPTTSENFTITLNAQAGSVYDVQLYSLDLSTAPTTNLMWTPQTSSYDPLVLEGGDAIDLAYTNTDINTWAVQVTVKQIR